MLQKCSIGLAILSLSLLASCNSKQQTTVDGPQTVNALDTVQSPRAFFPKERAQVLVVGTFHFNYPGFDKHKTSEDDKIDVLSTEKKPELDSLVRYIQFFKPNKIAIEAHPTWNTMQKYAEYKAREHDDKRDERYSLGMRIAQNMNLDTLYGIDAGTLLSDLGKKDSILTNSLFDKIDWDAPDPYWDMAKKWLNYDDKIIPEMHLVDYFKYMNSRESHNANYGLYLTGAMGTTEGQAADHLSTWWYNRNLRIFGQIVALNESPEDRILVIFGNGHAAILRQLLECTPQFDFVEFASLDK